MERCSSGSGDEFWRDSGSCVDRWLQFAILTTFLTLFLTTGNMEAFEM